MFFLFLFGLSQLSFALEKEEKSLYRDKKMFESYVKATINLYEMSPECFFPYKNMQIKTEFGTRRNMRALLCSDRMSEFCSQNKKMVQSVFKKLLNSHSFRGREFSRQCEVTPSLEKDFQKIRYNLKKKKEEFLKKATFYLEQKGLREKEERLLKELKSIYSSVAKQGILPMTLAEDLLKSESKILLSETLLHFARGNYYELEDVDLIEAFHQEQKALKKEFLKRKEEGSKRLTRLGLDKIRNFRTVMKYSQFFDKYCLEDHSIVKILKEFFVPDLQLVDLILRRRLQRAMWHLRALGEREKARALEKKVKKEILSKGNKTEITGLNLGFTESYRVYFSSGESVVYKPESLNVASGSKEEVASYIADRLLDINMVPLTFLFDYKEGRMGSSQFFVEEARLARSVSHYDGSEPRKLDRPSGRNTKTPKILLFDWLTANRDRNLDNYMFLDSGKVVFIDHGMSFCASVRPRYITTRFVKKRLPSLELHERMKALRKQKAHIVKKLSPYLSKSKIETFYVKIKLFSKKVDELIKKGEITLKSEKDSGKQPA